MSTQSADWIAAARVLRRSGFGARGHEVDALLAIGEPTSYVDELLGGDFDNDAGVAATPMPAFSDAVRPPKRKKKAVRAYEEKSSDQRDQLVAWWLQRMVAAERPAREKLTLLWHNHFATSASKVRSASLMASQNTLFRDLCLGDFRSLAYAALVDPAMIIWLDAKRNVAGSPNENLAREFMELFALGIGNGYTESDVREASRALTGWTISDGQAKFDADRHDASKKTILGQTGNFGCEEFCDIVLSHPNSPRFVASRLWLQLASDSPPNAQTLDRLERKYGHDRDLRALTTAILTDPAFLAARGSIVSGPIEWVVGVLRSLNIDMDDEVSERVINSLKSLDQRPFYPPNVSGWPSGWAWLSNAAAGKRLRLADKLADFGDISLVSETIREDRLDAVGYLIGVGDWSDRTAEALKPLTGNPKMLVAAAVNAPEYLTT